MDVIVVGGGLLCYNCCEGYVDKMFTILINVTNVI